jgi:hypothetical protein
VDPQISGFALGLLLGAAKVGLLGTAGFGIAWWRTRQKLKSLETALPDPAVLNERLAALEQASDYMSGKLAELANTQALLARQPGSLDRPALPATARDESQRPRTPA